MANLSTLSLLLIFSSSLVSLAESSSNRGESIFGVAAEQKEFDYFVLALQWPATGCKNVQKCCASNGCCRPNATNDFTIHGLWANYNDGSWPSCCNNGAPFDENEITPLLEGLQKYWPSLSCSKTSTCHGVKGLFWAHEWEKHGTCSTSVFQDEYSYFLATINLYLKYNITDTLIKEGYVPSNSEKYPLGGIISAIQNAVRATPQLSCAKDAIKELHLCFYKNFEPRDCDTSNSCPSYISLPEYLPRGLKSTTGIPWSSSSEAI